MEPIKSTLTDNQKVEIRNLILSTLSGYDDIMRIKSGQIESGDYSEGKTGWMIGSKGFKMYGGNGSNVQIDGPNNRFLVNDGTNDRVLIGFLAGKF